MAYLSVGWVKQKMLNSTMPDLSHPSKAYFKKEACELAFQLLTGPYRLPKEKLFVTFFGGSDQVQFNYFNLLNFKI